MFDIEVTEQLEAAVAAFADQPRALATDTQVCDTLRRLVAAIDRLDGLSAAWLDDLEERRSYEAEGASTAASWARRELRWDVKTSRAAITAGRTMRVLPKVGAARVAGEIRREHVDAFTVALKKADRIVVEEAEDVMLDVARTCEPATLSEMLTRLVDVAHPEELDKAYVAGMDKQDVKIARAGDGFHLNGFLDAVAGARLKEWLSAASAPRGENDDRSPAKRRLDALADLTASALEHGLPTDRGIRPQLQVLVEAEWLAGQAGAAPPVLGGWGPIGDKLFEYLACDADRTDLLVDGLTGGPTPQARVLNVGRTQRFATPKQRRAVHARQGGVCANPGCGGTHLELHHVIWWSNGGPTDLDLLVGLCTRCHQRIHSGSLSVASDKSGGFMFSRIREGRVIEIEDHQRVRRSEFVQRMRQLAGGTCGSCKSPVAEAGRGGGRWSSTGPAGRSAAAGTSAASSGPAPAASRPAPAASGPAPAARSSAAGSVGSDGVVREASGPHNADGGDEQLIVRSYTIADISRAARAGGDFGRLEPRSQRVLRRGP